MEYNTPKNWKIFKVSCYLVLAGATLWVARIVHSFFVDYRDLTGYVFSGVGLLFLTFVCWFQIINIRLLEKTLSGEELLMKLDSWAYYLLLRASFVVFAFLLLVSGFIVGDILEVWKNAQGNWRWYWFQIYMLVFTLLLLFNLIASIRHKRYLIKEESNVRHSLIDGIGREQTY